MFIITTRFSKKKAALLFLPLLAGILLLLCFLPNSEEETDHRILLKDNGARIAYLQSLGWTVDQEPLETLQLILPETLPQNYIAYNQIQLAQGFDLAPFCGESLTRYTYAVSNYPNRPDDVQLNLYLCGDQLVAGDIIASGINGFQSGLLYPGEKGAAA